MADASSRIFCAYLALSLLSAVVYGGVVTADACRKSKDFKISFPTLYTEDFRTVQDDKTGKFETKYFFIGMRDDSTCDELNVAGKDIVIRYSIEDSRVASVTNMTYVRELSEQDKEKMWKRGTLNTTITYKAAGKTKLTLTASSGEKKIGEGVVELVAVAAPSFKNDTLNGGAKVPENGKTERLVAPDNPSCFPASATVELESGQTITMSELKEGDKIRTHNDEFSPVFMFSHRDVNVMSHFVRARFSNGAVLVASHGHYIIAKDGSLVAMDSLQIGDEIMGGHHLVSVKGVVDQGLYNPHTLSGDLIVDGVLASSYTRAIKPSIAKALLSPLRMAGTVEWLKEGATLFGRSLLEGRYNAALSQAANKFLIA